MKKLSVALFFLAVLVMACSNKKKVTAAEVAPETCNCFSLLEEDIVMLKEIIITAGESADPAKYLNKSIEELRTMGTLLTLDQELDKLSKTDDESSPSGACFKTMHEKYEDRFDFKNEAMANELIVELKKQNCAFAAAMLSWKWKR